MEVVWNKTKSHLHITEWWILILSTRSIGSHLMLVKDFALGNYLFRAINLTPNLVPDNYKYSGCGTGTDACRSFLLSYGSGFG